MKEIRKNARHGLNQFISIIRYQGHHNLIGVQNGCVSRNRRLWWTYFKKDFAGNCICYCACVSGYACAVVCRKVRTQLLLVSSSFHCGTWILNKSSGMHDWVNSPALNTSKFNSVDYRHTPITLKVGLLKWTKAPHIEVT